MEMTYEEYCLMRKEHRRRFSAVGWTLLIYYGIMNAAVFIWLFAESMIGAMLAAFSGNLDDMNRVVAKAGQSAWGYFLAVAVGFLILLLWKKPAFWKKQIWKKGKPMKPGAFAAILCIILACQFATQIISVMLEVFLNGFGFSVMTGMQELAMDTGNFSMLLYGGILAPISEEILFRGLIQRSLMPYGKRFAIVCSAFTFGIFHGNLIQAPFAFLVGLVLGYVACEYSIAWAMVLHMINNLVLGDTLVRLMSGFPEMVWTLSFWLILLVCAVAAIVILIVRRKNIAAYRSENPINRTLVRWFFSGAGNIVLMVVMGLSMVLTLFVLITPI